GVRGTIVPLRGAPGARGSEEIAHGARASRTPLRRVRCLPPYRPRLTLQRTRLRRHWPLPGVAAARRPAVPPVVQSPAVNFPAPLARLPLQRLLSASVHDFL